jgi:hypothetical protein
MKVHRYFFDGDEAVENDSMGTWILYSEHVDALCEARKQGAQEERERIVRDLKNIVTYDGGSFSTYKQGQVDALRRAIWEAENWKSRGATEPRCTCLGSDGSRHYSDCPCYKPPERKPLDRGVIVSLRKAFDDLLDSHEALWAEVEKLRGGDTP